MTDGPRRRDETRQVWAERLITEAMRAVEKMGADPSLTDAITHLQEAREHVADFVDGN